MQKIRLDVAELRVDSFSVTPELAGRKGTVLGQSAYTLDFPYSMCMSDPDSRLGCPSDQLHTCQYTGCACEQDPDQTETCDGQPPVN
jgi:hypothetical protein